MISGRYVRYRNVFHCIFCDICDSIRNALKRNKKKEHKKKDGYRRWVTLEEGGGGTS